MSSSGDPSRIVPFPSPVSRPYDLLCFVLYGAQNQTLPEMPPMPPLPLSHHSRRQLGNRADHEGPASASPPQLSFVMFVVAGGSGPLSNSVPLPLARPSL